MSDVEHEVTSILLPPSRVAVFSKDQKTLEAARNMDNDWRFARVALEVSEGDIETAIEAYRDVPAADLIIIQTETIEDTFTDKLGVLAQCCDEGTSAIIIGPDNDVNLYRKLIDMGISDYLVKPVGTEVLSEISAKTLVEKLGVTGSRLITVLGAKGGVGASTIAQALACCSSDLLSQKTVLLEASGGWATAGVGLGFEPSTTLLEAVRAATNSDSDGLDRMLFESNEKLKVLASGGDMMLESSISPDQMESLIETLMVKFPVVVADLSHTPPDLQHAVLNRANEIVLVSTPTLPSLRLARSLLQEIKTLRGGHQSQIDIMINKQGLDKQSEVSVKDIQEALETDVSSVIGFRPDIFLKAESKSVKLTDDPEGQKVMESHFMPFLMRILSAEKVPESKKGSQGVLDGFMAKLGFGT